jgi:hypothetical protein
MIGQMPFEKVNAFVDLIDQDDYFTLVLGLAV